MSNRDGNRYCRFSTLEKQENPIGYQRRKPDKQGHRQSLTKYQRPIRQATPKTQTELAIIDTNRDGRRQKREKKCGTLHFNERQIHKHQQSSIRNPKHTYERSRCPLPASFRFGKKTKREPRIARRTETTGSKTQRTEPAITSRSTTHRASNNLALHKSLAAQTIFFSKRRFRP